MALGCAFIILIIIWLFRRHQRKQRAKKAAQFAKGLNPSAKKEKTGWRWKLLRFFGEKIFCHFCHSRSRRVPIARGEAEDVKLSQIRMMEEARPVASFATDANNNVDPSGEDMVQLIESYNPLPEAYYTNRHVRVHLVDQQSLSDSSSQHTAPSLYSQVTGLPHNVPEPRQPLKSRFSMSTFATNEVRKNSHSKKAFWKWSFSFFFPLSIIFFVASDLFFFHFFFQTHTYIHLPPPFSPINILDISYVFIYVHVYLHHTILHDDDEHPTFPYFILIIVSHGHLLFFVYRYDALETTLY